MIRAVPLLLLLLVLGLAACGDDAAVTMDGDLRYIRSGGFDGDVVELFVRPSGDAKMKSRRDGEKEFMLSEEELDAIAAEVSVVAEGNDAVSPKPAPDARVHSVTYEGSIVRADDPNLGRSRIGPLVRELEKVIEARR